MRRVSESSPRLRRLRLPAWHGSGVIAGGLVIELGAQFARTVVLARLLGATEFGIAAAINTLAAVAEMVSALVLDRYLVYAPDGDGEGALAAAHTLALARGVITALLAVALAWPTAITVGAGPYASAFALVALSPLLRGAANLGVYRQQRHHVFLPAAASEAGAALLGLAAGTAAALVAPDHRAIIWGLVGQAVGQVCLSHMMAGAQWRLSFDRARLVAALKFSLPLMGNGIALALADQLDRVVVGAWLGVAAVGIYGLSMTLLLQPVGLLQRLVTTAWQPLLSRAWHEGGARFAPLVGRLRIVAALLGVMGAAATACIGAPLFRLVFGASFAAPELYFLLLAGVVLLRVARCMLNLFGLSIGRTPDLMLGNAMGAVCLPLMIAAFAVHASLEVAALAGLVAEVAALAVTHARLKRHGAGADRTLWHGLALSLALVALLGGWILAMSPPLWLRMVVLPVGVAMVALLLRLESGPWKWRLVEAG